MDPAVEQFRVRSRPLEASEESESESDGDDSEDGPMTGADVAMLEQLLWQLGLSPQKGSPGSQGARIHSIRYTNCDGEAVWTTDCEGNVTEEDVSRRQYTQGSHVTCNNSSVSLEMMIRRFQGRSQGYNLRDGITDRVGAQTLEWLQDDWEDYTQAYRDHFGDPILGTSSPQLDTWLEGVIEVWDNGLGDYVPVTYTDATHNDVLRSAGIVLDALTRETYSRLNLLRAWKTQESPYHWGSNTATRSGGAYQPTAYRMAEGGADEQGSLSFSQLLYRYRYSDTPCTVYEDTALNLYHPADNMKAFAVHTAKQATPSSNPAEDCGNGSFFSAFVEDEMRQPVSTQLPDLVGYRQSGVMNTGGIETEDNYEVFAKAVGAYNGLGASFQSDSWPSLLVEKHYPVDDPETGDDESTMNEGDNCFSCKYTINVRNVRFGLPYREYVWQGGTTEVTTPDDPETEDVDESSTEQVPWCFAYGEEEWIDPYEIEYLGFDDDGNEIVLTRNATFSDYEIRASNLPEYRVDCE